MQDKVKELENKILRFKKHAKQHKKDINVITPTRVAIEIVSSIGVAISLGIFIDKYYHTRGIFLVLCGIIGLIAGAKNLSRLIR